MTWRQDRSPLGLRLQNARFIYHPQQRKTNAKRQRLHGAEALFCLPRSFPHIYVIIVSKGVKWRNFSPLIFLPLFEFSFFIPFFHSLNFISSVNLSYIERKTYLVKKLRKRKKGTLEIQQKSRKLWKSQKSDFTQMAYRCNSTEYKLIQNTGTKLKF